MSLDGSKPALVGIDWGTSSLRAFLISGAGEIVDSISSSNGIMQVPRKNFETVLDRLIGPWIVHGGLPILASGMISSRNGWIETPYADLPLGKDGLASALVHLDALGGRRIHFVTGAMVELNGRPDVMRGEETQIIGAAALGISNGTFVMPGTHSKWVRVANEKIVDFATYMTGEVFAALKDHTILGTLMHQDGRSIEAFEAGVRVGIEEAENLLHNLFQVRTLPLLGKFSEHATADYLSGLLIGTEIAAAVSDADKIETVNIVGRNDLSDRYETALKIAGLDCHRTPDDIVAKGHFLIARAAGLVG